MSIYKPNSVDVEPSTTLTHWDIYKIGNDYHLNGYVPLYRDGRFSSKLIEFDPKSMKGTTRSGRVYTLVGESGGNYDAVYVRDNWLALNKVSKSNCERVPPEKVQI